MEKELNIKRLELLEKIKEVDEIKSKYEDNFNTMKLS
jgi:hypothetical protein